eukprot:3415116-Pyramimonas_sp.AAC.1
MPPLAAPRRQMHSRQHALCLLLPGEPPKLYILEIPRVVPSCDSILQSSRLASTSQEWPCLKGVGVGGGI